MARRKDNSYDSEQTLTWIFLVMMILSLLAGLVGAAIHSSPA